MDRKTQRLQTRQALADAAHRLVREHGYDETTIEDIATDAGVSPRTFFRHFPTKEAALFSQESEFTQYLADALARQPVDQAMWVQARGALLETVTYIQAHGGWLLELAEMSARVPAIRDHMHGGLAHRMRDTLTTWAERRHGTPIAVDPTARVLAGVTAACAEAGMLQWIAHHGTIDLPDAVAASFDLLEDLVNQEP